MKHLIERITPIFAIISFGAAMGIGLKKLIEIGPGTEIEIYVAIGTIIITLIAGIYSARLARIARKLPHTRRIFLSYPYSEISLANEIADALRKAGVKVWVADEQIKPGQQIELSIRKAIKDSDAVVTLLTEEPSKYVSMELQLAQESNLPIIPVLLEDTELPASLFGLKYIFLPSDKEGGIDQIVEAST